MSFVAITKNDFDRARFYIHKFYENFLFDWSKLHPFDFTGKHIKLQNLQKVKNIKI